MTSPVNQKQAGRKIPGKEQEFIDAHDTQLIDNAPIANSVFVAMDKMKAWAGKRPADKTTDAVSGSMENYDPFRSVLEKKFGKTEVEIEEATDSPEVGSAPASSDNPGMGTMAIGDQNGEDQHEDVKKTLEGIALQAADIYEKMEDNTKVPDTMVTQLRETAKCISELYDLINQTDAEKTMQDDDTDDRPKTSAKTESVEIDQSVRSTLRGFAIEAFNNRITETKKGTDE